jgi:hypothetical protein
MRRLWIVIAAVLFAGPLLGCAPPNVEVQRAAADDLKCQGYGITVADPGYAQCRAAFAQQRAQQQQNALNALTLHGAYLPTQAPYIQSADGAVAVGPPPLTSCWPAADGWSCYSQNQ